MNTDLIIPDTFTTIDEFMDFMGKVQTMKRAIREMEVKVEERYISYIKDHGPLVEVGTMKFWLGHDKKTCCLDQRSLIEFIFENWSVDELEALLGSNAFKHGAFRKFLKRDAMAQAETLTPKPTEEEIDIGVGLVFDRFFVTEVKDTLESGEKAPKKLQSADTKFINAA